MASQAAQPSPAPIYQEHHLRERHYGRGGGRYLWWLVPVTIVVVILLFGLIARVIFRRARRSAPVPAAANPQPALPLPVVPPPVELTVSASYPPSPSSSEAGALIEEELLMSLGIWGPLPDGIHRLVALEH